MEASLRQLREATVLEHMTAENAHVKPGCAVLLQEVGDFIRPSSPPLVVPNLLYPALAALGRMRGYRGVTSDTRCRPGRRIDGDFLIRAPGSGRK